MFSTIVLTILSSVISATLAYLFSRQKSKVEIDKVRAETEKLKLDNIDNLIGIYKEATDDLRKEVERLRMEVQQSRIENLTLKAQIVKLEKTLAQFQPHN